MTEGNNTDRKVNIFTDSVVPQPLYNKVSLKSNFGNSIDSTKFSIQTKEYQPNVFGEKIKNYNEFKI